MILVLNLNCYGQNIKPLECSVLDKILTNSELISFFNLRHVSDDTLIIIDTFHLFSNCSNSQKYKVFSITDKIPFETKKLDMSSRLFLSRPFLNDIMIESVERKRKKYIIMLWQARNNGVIKMSFTPKGKKTKLKIFEKGYY